VSELVLSATIVGMYRGSPTMVPCSADRPEAAWITSSYAGLLPYGPPARKPYVAQ
jgi:hypothetical protein